MSIDDVCMILFITFIVSEIVPFCDGTISSGVGQAIFDGFVEVSKHFCKSIYRVSVTKKGETNFIEEHFVSDA